MHTWNRILFRCCLGLGEGHYPGFGVAARLLEQAHKQRLLPLAKLDDLSILLLLFVLPADMERSEPVFCTGERSGTTGHAAAFAEAQRRKFDPLRSWATLHEALRPNLGDFHYLAYNRQARQQGLIRSAYRVLYLPSLTDFVARATLAETDVALAFATIHFDEVFPSVQPDFPQADRAALVEDGLLIELYSRLLQRSDWALSDKWPQSRPGWVADLPPGEERFLNACAATLEPDLRCLLYLSFYAELNVRTITEVLRQSGDPNCRPADVVQELRRIWTYLLPALG